MMRVARALVGVMLLLMASGGAMFAQLPQLSQKDQALFDAISSNDMGGVKAAIQNGANVNAKDFDTWTPLLKAAFKGELDIVKLLLDQHADVNACQDGTFGTSLNIAAAYGYMELARILLDHHANINGGEGSQAGAPIIQATTNENWDSDHLEVAEWLLEHHADIEGRTSWGATALDMASKSARLDGAKWLLSHHANLESRDKDGKTPLMYAVNYSNYDEDWDVNKYVNFVRLLLENHANLEARDKDGKTPLLLAAQKNRPELVKALLDAHADASATAKDSKRAIDLAADKMRCNNVLVLEQGGRSRTMTCLQAAAAEFEKPDTGSEFDGEGTPDHKDLFKIAVNTRLAMTPLPTEVPQEARAAYVQGNTMFKASQSDDDAKKAIGMYQEAVILAPWFVDAWGNMEVVQEKIGDYKGAAESVGYLVKVEPDGAHDQAKLDHMYALQAKAKLAAQ